MENASKALIIAGSILIAIMIISLGIVIFNRFGNSAKKMANMDKQEIAAFNSKITPYVGNHVSGTQVNTLLQYCLSVNMSAKQSGNTYQYITVKKDDDTFILNPNSDSNPDSYEKVTTGSSVSYTVDATQDDNGLMTKIKITKNSTAVTP